MREELKPCPVPWCGSNDVLVSEEAGVIYWIQCQECDFGLDQDKCDEDADLIKFWNARPIEDALRAELDAAKERLAALEDVALQASDLLSALKMTGEFSVYSCAQDVEDSLAAFRALDQPAPVREVAP